MPRTALPVDRTKFEQAIQEVEANGPLATQSALFAAIAEKYNTLDANCKINPAISRLRVEGWAIAVKTLKARNFKKNGSAKSIIPDPLPPAKPVEPTKGISANKQRRMLASGSCGCGFLNVFAPAWECPVKLTGTDPDTVAKWAEKVMDAGHKLQRHYSPAALKYYVRHFYELQSEDWQTVVDNLLSLNNRKNVEDEGIVEDEQYVEDEGIVEDEQYVENEDDFSDLEEEPIS